MKRGIFLAALTGAFAAAMLVAGCGKDGGGGADPTEGGKYTFAAYCDFQAVQLKKADTEDDLDADDYKRLQDDCLSLGRQIANQVDDKKKQVRAEAAYVKVVMTKCEGKEGEDWIECRKSNLDAALEAANKAIR